MPSGNNLGQVVRTHVPLSRSSKLGTSQGAVMPCSWEGNRGSGVALAMCRKADGLIKGDEYPAYTLVTVYRHHRHHHGRVAGEGRRVVAPPCPRSTARLHSSPVGRVESFRSWSSHLFRGRPGGRRHVRSGGRLSDTMAYMTNINFLR